MWQELRTELHPRGIEIVTVALDANTDAARAVIEKVSPSHPALIDSEHTVDALFGIVNVPAGVWIDEQGMIVRPPEQAFPRRSSYRDASANDQLPQRLRDMLAEASKIRAEPEKYMSALRDWVENGSDSQYALLPDEVIERSRPRPWDEGLATAHFEMGAYLHQQRRVDDAARHWREAHRLQPGNWTYKRQAWSIADPMQGPTDQYEGDWLSDVRKTGAQNYYPPLRM